MSESRNREERQFREHKLAIEELARMNLDGNAARYKLGQLYYELSVATDISWDALDQYMTENYQCQIPSRSSMSRLRSVYETWNRHSGINLAELAPFSPYLLYTLQKRTEINSRTASAWLSRLRNYTRDQVLEAASGVKEEKRTDFEKLSVPTEIYTLLNDARAKMADAVGERKLTHTAFLEFVGQLVLDSNDANLRAIWAKMHGEELE